MVSDAKLSQLAHAAEGALKALFEAMLGVDKVNVIVARERSIRAIVVSPGVFVWSDPDKEKGVRALDEGYHYRWVVIGWTVNTEGVVMLKINWDGEEAYVDPRWLKTKL